MAPYGIAVASNENGSGCTPWSWREGSENVAMLMPRVWKPSPVPVCCMCQANTSRVVPPLPTTADAGQ